MIYRTPKFMNSKRENTGQNFSKIYFSIIIVYLWCKRISWNIFLKSYVMKVVLYHSSL